MEAVVDFFMEYLWPLVLVFIVWLMLRNSGEKEAAKAVAEQHKLDAMRHHHEDSNPDRKA